jgi:hypothetical protein
VSLTEDQAKLIIVMILDYLERNHKKLISKGRNKPTQNKVVLTNKSQAIARPVGNTGDAVRGFTGDVLIIDEASRMPDLVWAASRPTLLTTAGEIWMCSTPYGKQGYFWEAFQNKNNRFKVVHISSEEVINSRPVSEGWSEKQSIEAAKFLEGEREEMSELRYGQEYLGLFLDEMRRYFSDELIEKCCVLKRPETILRQRTYFMGCDLARMGGDQTTFEIVRLSGNKLYHVENIAKKHRLTTQTENDIVRITSFYDNIKKIYIDAGAGTLGVSIFDHLLERPETSRKIVAINNRARPLARFSTEKARLLKEDLYDHLRALMERGDIFLLDDPDVILSLASVQYEIISADAKTSRVRIFGNYTHIAEGLIRAAWGVKEKNLKCWVGSIKV